jgi:CheY-like chemotaxis protein
MTNQPIRRVLLCDDNPMLRALLANAVRESWPASEIVQTDNGWECEQIVRKENFEVIFMDLEMPRQNGLKTIQTIRSEKLAEGTPIVLCTGCTGETELASQLSIADYRITKPFDLEEVEDILDRIKWKGFSLT